jgi:hypothetical protein
MSIHSLNLDGKHYDVELKSTFLFLWSSEVIIALLILQNLLKRLGLCIEKKFCSQALFTEEEAL